MAAAEARLAQLSYLACQHCGNEVEKDYLICPSCHSRLREPCETAGARSRRTGRSARTARRRSSAAAPPAPPPRGLRRRDAARRA